METTTNGASQDQADVPTVPTHIDLPIRPMEAALTCASDDENRSNICGVLVHKIEGSTRMAGYDGKRLFVFSLPGEDTESETPEWLDAGIIIPGKHLKERLALLRKLDCEEVRITYQSAAQIVMTDRARSCLFRLVPGDGGTFPDYRGWLNDASIFEGREITDMHSVGYQGAFLKGVGEIAKMLGKKGEVRIFGTTSPEKPSLVTFPERPGAVLLLVPMRVQPELARETVKLVYGAVSGSIAALRAHQTRWSQRLDDHTSEAERQAIDAKVAEYEVRIAAILTKTQQQPALPPPSDDFEAAEAGPDGQADDAEQTPYNKVLEHERGQLKKTARAKAYRQWCADINNVLIRDHDGLSMDKLVEVHLLEVAQIEQWFSMGLTVEQAIDRVVKLAAPAPEDEGTEGEPTAPEGEGPEGEEAEGPDGEEAEATKPELTEENQTLARSRGLLRSDARRRMRARWRADINAALPAGLTISQLAKDVPINEWFDVGLTVEQAAEQCLNWTKANANGAGAEAAA